MRTFHHDRHELHGITVVVDTTGAEVYIGRCDDITDRAVILLDADVHVDGEDGRSKADYIARAVRIGTWKKHDRVELPLSVVASLEPLGKHAR